MSQKDTISRPPSRRSSHSQFWSCLQSLSQPTDTRISPSTLPPALPHRDDSGGTASPIGPGSVPAVLAHLSPQQTIPTRVGVHMSPNPFQRDSQISMQPSLQRPGAGAESHSSSVWKRKHGVSGSPYQPYGPAYPNGAHTIPPGAAASTPTPAQYVSLIADRPPFPPVSGYARRILTPTSRKPISFSRMATPPGLADSQPLFGYPSPTPAPDRPGGFRDVASFTGPRPGVPAQSARENQAPVALPPVTTVPRSLPQPAHHSPQTSHFRQGQPQAEVSQSPYGANSHPQGQYGLPSGSAKDYSEGPSSPTGAKLSTAMSNLQTQAGVTSGVESQTHIILETSTGDKMTVPIDFRHGSRQADEKRHRNAGASARFRERKRERDREMQYKIQRLEDENSELLNRIRDLQSERDVYREERDRLQDFVLRNPAIRKHAEQAPSSPRLAGTSATLGPSKEEPFPASFTAGGSPASTSPSALQHQHPLPYVGESMERPARRRRTDLSALAFASDHSTMRRASPHPEKPPPIVTQGVPSK